MQEQNNETKINHLQEAPKSKANKWLIGLLAVSVVGNGYLLMNKQNIEQQNTFLITENTDLSVAKDTLQRQFDAALVKLDQLQSENQQLDSLNAEQNEELQALKSKIKKILSDKNASIADLKEAQKMIKNLNGTVRKYEEQIATLKQENQNLSTDNSRLAATKDSIANEAKNMKELGSVLHVSNIQLETIQLKRNGEKEVSTAKARKTDLLRIIFDIDENRLIDNGEQELMITIKDPSGQSINNPALGSGISTTADGKSFNYTISKSVNLRKNEKLSQAHIDYVGNEPFDKGIYEVVFYHKGHLIGKQSVSLK